MRNVASATLGGVVAEAATPRRAQEYSIDLGATLELVDFLGDSGISGILLLGSAGEFVHFALHDRIHMVNFAVKRSRLPIFVNVSHSTLDGAVELAREAANAGASALLLMPPYYYHYSEETICSFFLAFANEVGDAAPVYVSETSASAAIQLLATGLFAGIVGSLDDIRTVAGNSIQLPFQLLAGCERIYSGARALGAAGVVSGIASAIPELMVAFDNALRTGTQERAARLEARVIEFVDWTGELPFPIGIKEAGKQRKLKMGAFAVAPGEHEGRKLEEFRRWLADWLPAVLKECRQ